MKAVVTGGAGFIGSHMVDALVDQGAEVHVIDNMSTGRAEHVHAQAQLHVLDIGSPQAKKLILRVKPDVVFHQAAQVDVVKSIADPVRDATVNIGGSVNIIEAAAQAGVKKLVYASSSAVYGDVQADVLTEDESTNPISFYGISKLTPELYLRVFQQLYGLPYTVLRYANVYGPRQTAKGEGGVIAIFLDRIRRGKPLTVFGDGGQTRDFVYVTDVVHANLAAMQGGSGATLQVGTSRRTSVREVVAKLEAIHGAPLTVEHEPDRPGDIRDSCLDHRRIRKHLRWTPQYELDAGLRETYAHVMNQP
ncbi:MAG TPA: NAD-dependent epimerase/dehydratase family protein [Bacilli bacterium]|nr:NAD-dependent epimerase/dehydratase family protein [Bacilli bacterium]